jgi:hypothetical protein
VCWQCTNVNRYGIIAITIAGDNVPDVGIDRTDHEIYCTIWNIFDGYIICSGVPSLDFDAIGNDVSCICAPIVVTIFIDEGAFKCTQLRRIIEGDLRSHPTLVCWDHH